MKKYLLALAVVGLSSSAFADYHFAFGYSVQGVEYCYPADNVGNVLGGSQPVPDDYCGPLHFAWGYAQNGGEYCYPADQNSSPLVGRYPVDYGYCP